jgi:hypothetical protein
MDLREKIGYLIYQFDDATPRDRRCRDSYLKLTDAILLLILATPDDEVEQAIGAAVPSA